ncbi:hypothetical protein PSHT_05362, partial [Puccinia striiformis]
AAQAPHQSLQALGSKLPMSRDGKHRGVSPSLFGARLDGPAGGNGEKQTNVSSLRDKRTRGAMTFGATKEIDALEAKSHPLHQRKHFQDLLPGSSAQTKQRQRHPMIEADVNKAEFKPN